MLFIKILNFVLNSKDIVGYEKSKLNNTSFSLYFTVLLLLHYSWNTFIFMNWTQFCWFWISISCIFQYTEKNASFSDLDSIYRIIFAELYLQNLILMCLSCMFLYDNFQHRESLLPCSLSASICTFCIPPPLRIWCHTWIQFLLKKILHLFAYHSF